MIIFYRNIINILLQYYFYIYSRDEMIKEYSKNNNVILDWVINCFGDIYFKCLKKLGQVQEMSRVGLILGYVCIWLLSSGDGSKFN